MWCTNSPKAETSVKAAGSAGFPQSDPQLTSPARTKAVLFSFRQTNGPPPSPIHTSFCPSGWPAHNILWGSNQLPRRGSQCEAGKMVRSAICRRAGSPKVPAAFKTVFGCFKVSKNNSNLNSLEIQKISNSSR